MYRSSYAPPKKSNAGLVVGLSLGAVGVLLIGVIGIAASSASHPRHSEAGYYTTSEPTYTTYSRGDTTAETTTSRPTATTSAGGDTTDDGDTDGGTTSHTGSSTPSGPSKSERLADNPLFGNNVATPGVTCNLARYQHSPAGQQALLNQALSCLETMWKPMLQSAGLPFSTPNVAFPSGKNWSSPCGSVSNGEAAAFYCSQNHTLYMPWTGLQSDQYGARPGVYLAVFAHEYGHHVQELSGVEDAYARKAYATGGYDTPEALALSRRLELEAQCFSGTFFAASSGHGAFDRNIVNEAEQDQERGDGQRSKRDHGSNAHAQAWWDHGYKTHTTAQCNTWAANDSDTA